MAAPRLALGCDLGATNLRVALVTEAGEILTSAREALEDRAPEAVATEFRRLAESVLGLAKRSLDEVAGVGIGLAGQVLGESGVVVVGPNLGWRDVDFAALVEQALGRPVRVHNDLSAAAWGEGRVGAAKDVRDALVVFLGSGVGAGLVLGGRLYEGASGLAGEIGHVKVRPGERLCGCGERGCLEAYVGGHKVAERLQELVETGQAESILAAAGGQLDRVGPRALGAAAEHGDPFALAFLEEMASFLGLAIGNAITVLNPERLVLGGGMFHGISHLRPLVEREVRRHATVASASILSISASALEDDAGLIGAGLLALETP